MTKQETNDHRQQNDVSTTRRDAETFQITSPAEFAALNLAPELNQRIEYAERQLGYHGNRQKQLQRELSHAYINIAMQCGWIGVGSWVTYRGYAYSDPLNSFVARYTTRTRIRKATTPIACLGIIMTSVTAYLLQHDITLMRVIRAATKHEAEQTEKALQAKTSAYAEGSSHMTAMTTTTTTTR